MRTSIGVFGMMIFLVASSVGCSSANATGLGRAPRGTFAQLACLDNNGDHRLNADDAADPRQIPDFDADGKHDEMDAAFFQGIDIPLDPDRERDTCEQKHDNIGPEMVVAHATGKPATVDCAGGGSAMLLFGVSGGLVNLRDLGDGAGVRSVIDGLQNALERRGVQTIAVIAGPHISGAENVHSGGEAWMTHAVKVFLDRYPCLRVVLVGHSHGAISADVISSRLEDGYADRIVEVADIDRREDLYIGDTHSRPSVVHVLNIYETNEAALAGVPYDSSNAENWDASGELAPENGDKGGKLLPVTHTTIDNCRAVRDRIVADVLSRM